MIDTAAIAKFSEQITKLQRQIRRWLPFQSRRKSRSTRWDGRGGSSARDPHRQDGGADRERAAVEETGSFEADAKGGFPRRPGRVDLRRCPRHVRARCSCAPRTSPGARAARHGAPGTRRRLARRPRARTRPRRLPRRRRAAGRAIGAALSAPPTRQRAAARNAATGGGPDAGRRGAARVVPARAATRLQSTAGGATQVQAARAARGRRAAGRDPRRGRPQGRQGRVVRRPGQTGRGGAQTMSDARKTAGIRRRIPAMRRRGPAALGPPAATRNAAAVAPGPRLEIRDDIRAARGNGLWRLEREWTRALALPKSVASQVSSSMAIALCRALDRRRTLSFSITTLLVAPPDSDLPPRAVHRSRWCRRDIGRCCRRRRSNGIARSQAISRAMAKPRGCSLRPRGGARLSSHREYIACEFNVYTLILSVNGDVQPRFQA